jgi:hypothetical protein
MTEPIDPAFRYTTRGAETRFVVVVSPGDVLDHMGGVRADPGEHR